MADTDQGLAVKWDGSDIGYVVSGDFADVYDQEDCSTIDDTQRDFRSSLLNPSGSLTISLKDSNTPSITLDDVGTLTVSTLARKVRISEISKPVGVGAHSVMSFSFVSTEEST
jgi:hypothetical protein